MTYFPPRKLKHMKRTKRQDSFIEIFPCNPPSPPEEIQTTLPDEDKPEVIDEPETFTVNPEEFREPILKAEVVPIKDIRLTYPQVWQAYDKAKTNEDGLFKQLLEALLFAVVEEPENKKVGRKGYSRKEKLCYMCLKVFYKADLRKIVSTLKELQKAKYIERVPSFKSIDNFFNDPTLTEVLDDLILVSALPLANLEETGGIDSTGFSVSKFDRWMDYKWGKISGKERVWRKAHACIGCRTNIFLSVEVTEKNVSDSVMVEKVVADKTRYFKMSEFVADKAYLSRRIMKYLFNLGLTPYIPFKSNSSGKPRGCMLWRTMFEMFNNYNPIYMKKYHQRSNSETGFWMVKQNYGDYLFTKNFIANVNEIKVKFLCQNLVSLIQEAFEIGIEIDFESCVEMVEAV